MGSEMQPALIKGQCRFWGDAMESEFQTIRHGVGLKTMNQANTLLWWETVMQFR
jgi:hypothetical protein